jgi:hypothetical protein
MRCRLAANAAFAYGRATSAIPLKTDFMPDRQPAQTPRSPPRIKTGKAQKTNFDLTGTQSTSPHLRHPGSLHGLCCSQCNTELGARRDEIEQLQSVARRVATNPDEGPTAQQSVGAQLGHQPTPASVKMSGWSVSWLHRCCSGHKTAVVPGIFVLPAWT